MGVATVSQVDGSDKVAAAVAISALAPTTSIAYGQYVVGSNVFFWKYVP